MKEKGLFDHYRNPVLLDYLGYRLAGGQGPLAWLDYAGDGPAEGGGE